MLATAHVKLWRLAGCLTRPACCLRSTSLGNTPVMTNLRWVGCSSSSQGCQCLTKCCQRCGHRRRHLRLRRVEVEAQQRGSKSYSTATVRQLQSNGATLLSLPTSLCKSISFFEWRSFIIVHCSSSQTAACQLQRPGLPSYRDHCLAFGHLMRPYPTLPCSNQAASR